MLRDSPLIVIGYRGYEQSVVKHLLARKFHTQIEQKSGGSVRRLEDIRPNDDDTHRFFCDRL